MQVVGPVQQMLKEFYAVTRTSIYHVQDRGQYGASAVKVALRGGSKINFLDLRIPKSQQLAKEDLQQFQRLRDERQAMLRENNNRVVTTVPKSL